LKTGKSRIIKTFGKGISRWLIFMAPLYLLFAMGVGKAWSQPTPDIKNGWFVNMKAFAESAHASITCEYCHGDMTSGRTRPHPDPRLANFLKSDPRVTYDYSRCQTCHRKSYERYLLGEHAKVLAKLAQPEPSSDTVTSVRRAPTCGNCHSAHYARAHLSRVEIGKLMTAECGSCHPDQQKSYLENYHGKTAVNLEYDKGAYCTDCHSAHTTLSLQNPDNRLTACKRCHPKAGAEFANIVIHYSHVDLETKDAAKKTRILRIGLISVLSLIFVVVLLIFFYSHAFLLMLRKMHEKLRKHE